MPPEDHELDRNGEPAEDDDWTNGLLYVIVIGALAVIIGVELLGLWLIVGTSCH